MIWEEAVKRWQREKPRQPSDKQDSQRIEFLNSYLSGKPLNKITTNMIEVIISDLQRAGKKESTINRTMVPLRVILRRAERLWGEIDKAPYVRVLREPEGRTRWLKPDEFRTLIKELPRHLSQMARFSAATGLRASNVSKLEWSQVDLGREVCWIYADQSKNRRAISVPLNDMAMSVLSERKGIHPVHVFTYKGRRIRQLTNRSWREAARRAGLDGVTFHTLRHSWASWHIQSGTRTFELQQLGGWKSGKMVERYAHLSAEHLHKTARKLPNWLSGNVAEVVDFEAEESGAGNEARTRDLNLGKVREETDGTD